MKRSASIPTPGSIPSYRIGEETYNKDKLGLGSCMIQIDSPGNEGKWIGPVPIAIGRPVEQSTSIPSIYPWAMRWSQSVNNRLDWIFLADNATAGATRRINAYQYNRLTGVLTWLGSITLTLPPATNHTIRALRMTYDKYTKGTAAVSGTTVTGTGTEWLTDKIAAGCRIGFGSTNPEEIVDWYEITPGSAISNDTSLTLSTSAGTIANGPYVIEDIRCIIATTNATATNGGLFVVKGLRIELFNATPTTIAAATNIDRIRACYWLKDAGTVTNTIANGMGIEDRTDWQTHYCWVGNGTTTQKLYKYNLRAALTVSSGASTSAFEYATAVSATLVGTASQSNNGRVAAPNHGPGNGVSCYYFTTTSRIYRTKPLASISSGDTTFITAGDVMSEVPPGGTATFSASNAMGSIEYMGSIDKFLIAANATTTPFRSYITQYRTDLGQIDRIFGVDMRQLGQTTTDNSTTPVPTMISAPYSVWAEQGMAYLATIGTSAQTNYLYAVPIGADWEYADMSGCYIITPRVALPDVDSFDSVILKCAHVLGNYDSYNLQTQTEPCRVYYRTAGIDDNSGGWTVLDQTGRNISGIAGAPYIQFRLEFRTIGLTCVPTRVFGINVIYNDSSGDGRFQFSQVKSNAASKIFAWRYSVDFGGTVSGLRVRLYDAVTNGLLNDDNTNSPTGTFERSADGGSTWSAWTNADRSNENTYIRYTPASLADNIKVRPVLTVV